jgi:hydrogenase maturation protein HypF
VGWVRNTSAGVDIEIDISQGDLDRLIDDIKSEAPPLAQIDNIDVTQCEPAGFSEFEIVHSAPVEGAFQPISPDVSICVDCMHELLDPKDRRYLYPFINCTNCGPRFTIIDDIPYDRPNTTMGPFQLCPDCAAEYKDPLDRRFHAQPVACPNCGPQIWLENPLDEKYDSTYPPGAAAGSIDSSIQTIFEAQNALVTGKIVAIKGLGGFHLACDAINHSAVSTLRERKLRVDKPFALMMPDIKTVTEHCHINVEEQHALTSHERPIVVLRKRKSSPIVDEVAPGQNTLGVMLPYTPLHYLLFAQINPSDSSYNRANILVMTSGNLSEEPIAFTNQEARLRLHELADVFLMNNRPIHTRCDDSVIRLQNLDAYKDIKNYQDDHEYINHSYPLRRSRGYAPNPLRLSWKSPSILAGGAELKNTFCLTRDDYAFLSHHIGDLENFETLQAFESSIGHYQRLFRIKPEVFSYDLHPDYLATRYILDRANQEDRPAIGVQHHHAHIAACMAEHNIHANQPVIGVSYDGIGYGLDGAIWGGEILINDYTDFKRPYHLKYSPMPGGDLATRHPWRMALSWLATCDIPWTDELIPVRSLNNREPQAENQLEILHNQVVRKIHSPETSSMGRLFDAVAALIGIRQSVNYEAQAAIEMEALADQDIIKRFLSAERSEAACKTHYSIDLPEIDIEKTQAIDPSSLFREIIKDLAIRRPISEIAAKFHISIAHTTLHACEQIQKDTDIDRVVLSGGVWQNMILLRVTHDLLRSNGFKVYSHCRVPTNDGGLALGQAAISAHRLLQN